MQKFNIILSFLFCLSLNAQEPNKLGSLFYLEVNADVETEPVFAGDDAAYDMCVLENLMNPEKSLIISLRKRCSFVT